MRKPEQNTAGRTRPRRASSPRREAHQDRRSSGSCGVALICTSGVSFFGINFEVKFAKASNFGPVRGGCISAILLAPGQRHRTGPGSAGSPTGWAAGRRCSRTRCLLARGHVRRRKWSGSAAERAAVLRVRGASPGSVAGRSTRCSPRLRRTLQRGLQRLDLRHGVLGQARRRGDRRAGRRGPSSTAWGTPTTYVLAGSLSPAGRRAGPLPAASRPRSRRWPLRPRPRRRPADVRAYPFELRLPPAPYRFEWRDEPAVRAEKSAGEGFTEERYAHADGGATIIRHYGADGSFHILSDRGEIELATPLAAFHHCTSATVSKMRRYSRDHLSAHHGTRLCGAQLPRHVTPRLSPPRTPRLSPPGTPRLSPPRSARRPRPSLSRGRHADPDDGTCAMELASDLAGEPWSDHPACVHPVLAAIARAVNDGTGEAGRARLAALVPAMIGTGGSGSWLLASCARLALCCAGAALDHTGADEPEMTWARETALAVLARQRGGGHDRGSATARLSVSLLDRAWPARGHLPGPRRPAGGAWPWRCCAVPASAENDRRRIQLLGDCIARVPGGEFRPPPGSADVAAAEAGEAGDDEPRATRSAARAARWLNAPPGSRACV